MNLASILIGILIGGGLMWVVDWFFYGQLHDKGRGRVEELQTRLEALQNDLQELQRKLETSESLRQTADSELVTARADTKQTQTRIAYLERQLGLKRE